MNTPIHVSIIYNEPTVQTDEGRKFVSETAMAEKSLLKETARTISKIDMSEVGVLEQKEDIKLALQSLGYRTTIFNMSNDMNRFFDFLSKGKPDIIFNMVESLGDQAIHEMHVAGMYELLGFTYTGASPIALGTCLNKARTKEILTSHKIPTPKYFMCTGIHQLNADDFSLSFPVIVKPAKEDASVGIDNNSICSSFTALQERVRFIFNVYQQPAIIEEYIDGRELNVAVIGETTPEVLPISEIDFSGLPKEYPKIVTYDAKWMIGTAAYEGTTGVCPADLPNDVEEQIKKIAKDAFSLMGCRDYARIDMRLSKKNQPYVIEVNPNPDISADAGFYRSAKAAGYSYAEIIGKIVGFAIERKLKLKK